MTDTHAAILRASRLEALVPPLIDLLQAHAPEDPLAAQTVIAAHPGMKQWLVGAMAHELGPGGIVANVEVLLPSAFLTRATETFLGPEAGTGLSHWQKPVLRWLILDILSSPEGMADVSEARVRHYLDASHAGADVAARRRFQLAEHLAGLFSQYLVYRSDWIDAWKAGKDRFATAAWPEDADVSRLESGLFAPLWRHLAQRLGPHRGDLTRALLAGLDKDPSRASPLHVFGFSHLAPAEQQVLQTWARHAPVFVYVPDPCREYWGGLGAATPAGLAGMRAWHAAECARIDAANGGDWLDTAQTHPLLQRWGRLGQHFYASLAGWDSLADIRAGEDAREDEPQHRLDRLQESVRRLDITVLVESEPFPHAGPDKEDGGNLRMRQRAWWQARRLDASLRIHACHTRLRELEVLRDALLDALDAGIAPGRIVVMAPDIDQYAPLLPAVLGAPGEAGERRLPWHLADVPLAQGHRLFSTFQRLLALGDSRLTLPELADLLAVPDVAHALSLDADARAQLLQWLHDSHAAWALDGAHRAQFGVPAQPEHTLGWALDRLIAGHVYGDDGNRALRLPEGDMLLPVAGVTGPESAALGALDHLLCELQAWRDLSCTDLPASRWAESLNQRLEALVRPAADDDGAQAALSALRAIVMRLASEPARVGLDPLLPFSVVRQLLGEALEQIPERQRFLVGGITVCGMVPQRAIPFDMVCVLGLNDGDFPRPLREGGLDLMARLRRVGDRDVRSDDRWLFLETVMSARRRLHLSWLGQDARDGSPRNPASPLAELMMELDRAAGVAPLAGSALDEARPWCVKHPLQAFDARYFDGSDPALFSYVHAYAALDATARTTPSKRFLPMPGEPLLPNDPWPANLSIATLVRYWKRPAEDLLRHRLRLDLAALEDADLRDSEPLEGPIERLENVSRRVFLEDALPAGFAADGTPNWSPSAIPDWVAYGGLLPPGALGEQAWQSEANTVLALLGATAGKIDPSTRHTRRIVLPLDLPDGERIRLTGRIEPLYLSTTGNVPRRMLVRPFPRDKDALRAAANLTLGDRLDLFVTWAALRLAEAEDAAGATTPLGLLPLVDGELALVAAIDAWETRWHDVPEQRAALADDLRARLLALLEAWRAAASAPAPYFPGAAAALATREDGKAAAAVRQRFEGSFGQIGERHYAPGWNRLLARGLSFDPDDAGGTEALAMLLSYTQPLEHLMQLDLPDIGEQP